MTRIFLHLTNFENCKLRYLSGISIILQHPLKTIEMSRFHWEKYGEFRWWLWILQKWQNVKYLQNFVSSKVYQWFWIVKSWICFKFGIDLLRTLHKQLKWNSRYFPLFEGQIAWNWKDAIWNDLRALYIRFEQLKSSKLERR